ncbi:uncharacterized protein [Arachis hypogaea]|uniref:uncharacterized protein n=1 Tax=Arachis hypogaea TaxID=3818 RepID=UPI003B215339
MRKAPGLVGDSQSAFMKGKKIHDGALIACETVHWLKSRKKSSAIIKMDFQKAYDRVKWSLWIFCYTKWDLASGEGTRSRSNDRREAVRNGRTSPLLVGQYDIELSHLQFADDIILFCPTEEDSIRHYKWLLRCFEMMYGLSINFEKSGFIPVNCERCWTRKMCNLLGCKEASLPVKYLGISLGANLRLVRIWKPVIDKVEEKLSLLYKMPKAVAEKLISLQRRFLWSKEDGRNEMPLVKWDLVMATKKTSGLRVGDVVAQNTALLFK